jgi:hypothetical protein
LSERLHWLAHRGRGYLSRRGRGGSFAFNPIRLQPKTKAGGGGGGASSNTMRFASNSIIGVPKNVFTTTTTLSRTCTVITLAVPTTDGVLWFGIPGFYVNTSGIETSLTIASTMSMQVSLNDGTNTGVLGQGGNTLGTLSGNTTFNLNNGGITWVGFSASQLSLSQFPANTPYYLKVDYTGTIGDTLPVHDDQGTASVTGESWYSGGTTSLTVAGGNTAGGGTSRSLDSRPCAIACMHGKDAIFAAGDSILYGQGRSGGTGVDTGVGAYGMLGRACYQTGMAYGKYARQGVQATAFTGSNTNYNILAALGTLYLTQPGTNDIGSGGVSLATLKSRYATMWTALLAVKSNPIYAIDVLIRCSSSSDSWITAAGQTIQSQYAQSAGNVQFDINAYLDAGGVSNLTGSINLISTVQDAGNLGKWKTDGATTFLETVDGTHPSLVGHTALGVSLRAALATILGARTTPDTFTFTAVTNVGTGSVQTSNTVTITGINTAAAISITGGTYSINGGSYVSSSGTVNAGDTVSVRQTASGSGNTTTNAVLTIGSGTTTYAVTTNSGAVTLTSVFTTIDTSGSVTTTPITTTTAVETTETLIMNFAMSGVSSITGISDGLGNTYALDSQEVDGSNDTNSIYSCTPTTRIPSGTVITVTWAGTCTSPRHHGRQDEQGRHQDRRRRVAFDRLDDRQSDLHGRHRDHGRLRVRVVHRG